MSKPLRILWACIWFSNFCILDSHAQALSPSSRQLAIQELSVRLSGVEAAGVIEAGLKKLELNPVFPGNSFRQKVSYFSHVKRGKNNALSISTHGLVGDAEFAPLPFSASGKVEDIGIVFAGYGIQARDEKGRYFYDDYRGIDAKGKAVIILLGDPSLGADKSRFRDSAHSFHAQVMHKVQLAKAKGAKLIIFVKSSEAGAVGQVELTEPMSAGSNSRVLALMLSQAWAEKILSREIKSLQERIAKSQSPRSFIVKGKLNASVELDREVGQMESVAAVLPGKDSRLANEFIVLSANYGPGLPGDDDSASGAAAVMDLALELKSKNAGRRSILFIFFAREEIGSLGASYFLDKPSLPVGSKIIAMLNFDKIGRLNSNSLSLLAVNSGQEFSTIITNSGRLKGMSPIISNGFAPGSSHQAFLERGIPAIFFTTGYSAPGVNKEILDKVDLSGVVNISDFTQVFLRRLDGLELPPKFNSNLDVVLQAPPGESYFGAIPAPGGSEKGIKINGVDSGSPAANAGLQENDLLTRFGDIILRNSADLNFALRVYPAEDVVSLEWTRGDQIMSAQTKLGVRGQRENSPKE